MQNKRTVSKSWILIRIITIVLIAAAPFLILSFAMKSHKSGRLVSINSNKIIVEIATTSQEQERGLCCRDSLPANNGMLFVYTQPGDHRFWMKDTRIPLDMYWIDANKKIVHIEHNVQPSSYPQSFGTDIPSKFILETNAGYAKQHNIQVGDKAFF